MKKLILIIIAFVISPVAFSQTAYEKKCAQIFTKYWNLFYGKPMSQYEKMQMQSIATYDIAKGFLQVGALNYAMQTGKNLETLLKQVEKEYILARSLMTKQEKAVFRVDEECKTNFGKQKWEAVRKFINWSKKEEYETTPKYEERLQNESKEAFDDIMYRQIKEFMKENPWTFEYGTYNADKEKMVIKFLDKKNKEHYIAHYLECDPDVARYLKSECNHNNWVPEFHNGEFILNIRELLMMQYNLENVLTDGKDLCPAKFYVFTEQDKWILDNSIYSELKNVVIKYDELMLQDFGTISCDKYMKGHIFDYAKYTERSKEQAKLLVDSLNKCIVIKMNKLDSLLARNKYNTKHYTIDDGYKLLFDMYRSHSSSGNTEVYSDQIENVEVSMVSDVYDLYNEKLEYANEAFKKINFKIDNEFNEMFEKYKQYYENTDDFAEYYCQGTKKLTEETNNRIEKARIVEKERQEKLRQEEEKRKLAEEEYQVKTELEKNKYSIAEVNFLKDKNVDIPFTKIVAPGGTPIKNYSDENRYRHELIAWAKKLKEKTYYDYVIEFFISNNSGLNNEYIKNGSKFSSKVEFYEAYTSGNYKAVLRSKK